MGVFSRFSDIINSNINAILDKAEDPDKIIRMVIQEMEDTLIEVRSSAARIIADQKDGERQLKKLNTALADWDSKAELAISKGREDLARGALIEKNNVADMVAHLSGELEALQKALTTHEDDVVKLEGKLREARAKKATIDARHKAAVGQVKIRKNLYDNRIQDAFDRFDKVEARIDRLEGEAEAMAIGANGEESTSLAAEINALQTTDAIEQELEALKARVTPDATEATEATEAKETKGSVSEKAPKKASKKAAPKKA